MTGRTRPLVIGTRGSALALAQTEIVRRWLDALYPELPVEVTRITTRGDVVLDRPLSQLGGQGLFVTEIERALRDGAIDVAVHSAKDLPSALADDMQLAAFLPRADPRDVLVSVGGGDVDGLPPGATVGTSSPRRACQLRAIRPDLALRDIRGNVDTRLRKLDAGDYDALVLAAAGLDRLGVRDARVRPLRRSVMVPAVGQGALALEVRAGDADVAALVAPLDHVDTAAAVHAERAFLATVGGGCDTAVAAHVSIGGDRATLFGVIGAADGRLVRTEREVARADVAAAAGALARDLLADGGAALLRDSPPRPG